MKRKSPLISLFFCCMLGGCASPKVEKPNDSQDEVDRKIQDTSRKIERMKLQLVQSGALGQSPKVVPVSIASGEHLISFSWKGDAYRLLAKIAADRGLEFATTGVRLPLPIALSVHDQPIEVALELIRAQIAYRATVVQTADKISLQFNRHQSLEEKP